MRRAAFVLFVLSVLFLAPHPGFAQDPSVLAGRVTDASGAAVTDATVEVAGATRRVVGTDGEGRFSVDALAPGEYRVTTRREGFAPSELRVTVPAREPVNVTLSVADVTEFVETVSKVREEAIRTPFFVSEVTGEEIRRTGALTFEEALRSVPGLQHGTQGNAFTRISTRGLRDTADVLVLLDGVPFRQLNGAADLAMLPVPALQGVEFVKGPASSMYGRSAVGGVMPGRAP
jgi:outer membrane receptor protein involved in Fe transport